MPANVGLWGGIACMLGQHVRSRGQARATPEGWISRCARCAMPMARAHGGGKWQVVKTPKLKRRKRPGKPAADEVLAKAMSRSRQAGARKEEKDAKAARKAVAQETAPVDIAVIDDFDEAEPVAFKRRLFRRKRRSDAGDRPKRARRLLFFRKGAATERDDDAEAEIDGMPT